MAQHGLIKTLRSLKGNVRGVVFTEPLWGIPFNLYAPYVSVYMLALGMDDAGIGTLVTVSSLLQVFWTLLAGAVTDKLGRKRTTLIFDTVSWSLPCIIWAVAQNPVYFYVAAFVNAVWRVTDCSWGCLVVEDTDPDILVDVWSWIQMSGLVVAFVAPLSGLMVARFGLVPTMRGLYWLSLVMMTSKFLIMNALVVETTQGIKRMAETADEPLFSVVKGLGKVLRLMGKSPATMYALALSLILTVTMTVRRTFWPILASQALGVAEGRLALYPALRSLTMLVFFFAVMPHVQRFIAIDDRDESLPMILGFVLALASQVLFILVPPGYEWALALGVVLEGCSIPLTTTLLQKVVATTVDAEERARVMSLFAMALLVGTAPFGWLAGQLSTADRRLPFVMTATLLAVGGLVTYLATQVSTREAADRSEISASPSAE